MFASKFDFQIWTYRRFNRKRLNVYKHINLNTFHSKTSNGCHYYMSNDSRVKHDLYYNKTAFRKFNVIIIIVTFSFLYIYDNLFACLSVFCKRFPTNLSLLSFSIINVPWETLNFKRYARNTTKTCISTVTVTASPQ